MFRSCVFRMPRKPDPARQLWIDAITKHQNFTAIDEQTLNYSVCNLHFDPAFIKGINRPRLMPGAIPIHFPQPFDTIHATSLTDPNQNENEQVFIRFSPPHETIYETSRVDPNQNKQKISMGICEKSSWYSFVICCLPLHPFFASIASLLINSIHF